MPFLNRDGFKLAYEDAGTGHPPLLLLHGWAADRSHLAPQFEHFRRRHRVVRVDLRGHGESGGPDESCTIEQFASDAAFVCAALGVAQPVVVGHSMGGTIGLELTARHPTLHVAGLVILEALVVAPAGLVEQFLPVLEGMRSPSYPVVMRQFIEQLLGPTYEPAAKAECAQRMMANRQRPMVSAFESVLSYDSTIAAAACAVPVLYVSSGPWYTDVERFTQLCPTLVTGQIVGAGHYFPLEVPNQVNPMIERFIEMYIDRLRVPPSA